MHKLEAQIVYKNVRFLQIEMIFINFADKDNTKTLPLPAVENVIL
jgi:hypothetical protein